MNANVLERWDATTAIIPDIALLRIPFRDHPHAEIDGNCDPTDELYGWAYPVTRDTGDSFQGACEGPDGSGLIKFRDTVIEPGMSGAPILNLRTGKVCGMLKVTRDKDRPSGGRAVSGGMLQRFLSPPPNEADFLEGLPTRWASQVDAFLVQYLGTASSPAPFGGRQKDLEELDAWLGDESAARYGLLEARGGLGKSALLAHWIHRLGENGAACGLVYFPISARWRTNSESALFESLGFRLASLFGETGPRSQDLRELRDVFKKYLARAGAESRRLLLVVDGLDEAAGWQAGTDLFPPTSRGNVRILVAARPIGEGARGWLGKLGWNTAGVVKRFHLNGLDRTGLADVLQRMGDPLAPLAARLNLVNLLAEKSDGDPLLVGLYVNKWRDYVDDPQTFDVRRMQQIEPGLAGFFQYWLDDQIELWGEARHEREPRVRTLMTLCALAHGPLTQEDVQGLAPDMFGSRRAVEDAAHDLRRLVIGDGRNQGYTFGHPRLGVFIREEKLEERELRQYEQRFLSYGSEVIDAFQRGQRSKVPDYVVRWRSTHLTDARRPCVEYRPLLNASWCREWERVDGTPAGFLGDLEKAWQSARGPAECGVRLRISLLRASVRTPGRGVTQELFVQCVSEGIISPTLAEVIARQQASPRDVCGYLVAIANGDDRERLLEAALSVVGQVWDEGGREYALRGVVERLGTEDGKLLQRALVIARKMRDNRERAEALKGVGEKLPPGDREEVLEEALAAARKLEHESYRAWALSAISDAYSIRRVELLEEILALAGGARDRVNVLNSAVSRMTPDDRPLLRAALAVVRQMPDDEHRRFMLCEVSNQFGSGDEDLLAETLTVAREIKDEWSRAWSLSVLAQKLRPSDRAKVWTEALVAAQEEQDERKRAHVLAEMAELLRPDDGDLLHGILTLMDRLHGNERTRAGAYTLVAERLGPCDREKALAKALETARQIENAYRPGALLAIADLLAPSDREGLLAEALATARQIEKNDERAKALLAVARRSDAERREERILEALAAVRQLIAAPRESYDRRVDVLNAVLTQLAPEETELLQGVLRTAREIGEQLEVVEALSSVARKMEGQDGEKVLEEALAVARRISDEGARARAFSAVAERLGAADRRKVLGEAVKTACQIGDESARATALSAVVEKLTPLDGELVQEAVSAGRQMEDGTAKAKALGAVAEKLGRKDRQNALGEALQAASQIPRERERRYALSEVVEKLSAEDRELLQLALRTARQIADGGLRAEALSDVAERSGVADLFHEALESARKDDYLDRHTLSRIAGRLGASDRELAREVLAMTRELEDLAKTERGGEIGNVDVLWALLKHMKPEDREWADEILTLAREMGNELSRARALVLLVKRFPVGDRKMVFKEALAAVRDLPYEGERAAGLGDLAAVSDPEDKEKIFEEALAVIRQIDDEDTLEEALRCVASDLGASDQKFLDLVRAEAPRVNNPIRRARVLSIIAAQSDSRSVAGFAESLLDIADEPGILGMLPSLAARWADFCRFRKSTPSDELGLWLERLSRGSRPHLIDAMRALIPAIEEVGGQTALSEMVLAMADTGLSWP